MTTPEVTQLDGGIVLFSASESGGFVKTEKKLFLVF